MKINKTFIIIILTALTLISIIGIIYVNETKIKEPYIVKNEKLKITYENNDEIINEAITPGWSETKIFTVENTSNQEIIYKIRWNNLTNNLKDKVSLVNKIKKDGKYLLEEIQVLESNKKYPIVFDIVIKAHETHKYIFNISYKKQEYDQNEDLNKTLKGKLEVVENDIEDGYFIKEKEYKIKYNLNGGYLESENPLTYNTQTSSITLKNPIKTGYIFKGWSGTALANKTSLVIIPEGSVGTRTYTANFEPITYYIKFNSSGGKGKMEDLTLTYDENVALPKNEFSKTGYIFKGWATEKNKEITYTNEKRVKNLTIKDKDIINLYALWERKK